MSELDKSALRRMARALREVDSPKHPEAAARVAAHALAGFAWSASDIAAAYAAVHGEIDALPLLVGLRARGVATALPCVSGTSGPLTFRRWSPGDPLVPAAHGTRAPAPGAPETTPTSVFVPLLAYDGRGARLGYGGGYFDRTLGALRAANPGLRAIGLAYRFQRLDRIPRESHDQLLDAVVTEDGVERFSRGLDSK